MDVIDFSNYLRDGGLFSGFSDSLIIFTIVFYLILDIIIGIYFIKAYRKLKKNLNSLENVKPYLYSLIVLVVWNFGDIMTHVSYLLTDRTQTLFSSTENIFFPISVSISLIYFISYLKIILPSRKYNQTQKRRTDLVFNFATFAIVIALVVMIGRWALIGFFGNSFRYSTDDAMQFTLFMISMIIVITLFIGIVLLRQEYRQTASNLNRGRLSVFMIYFVAIISSVVILGTSLVLPNEFRNIITEYLIAIIPFSLSTVAALSLYYGMFLPINLQRRMGLLPDF